MTRRVPRVACVLAGLAVAGSGCRSDAPGVSRAPDVGRFRTDGHVVYVSAVGFPHGGCFDPKVGKTKVYVGRATTPPS